MSKDTDMTVSIIEDSEIKKKEFSEDQYTNQHKSADNDGQVKVLQPEFPDFPEFQGYLYRDDLTETLKNLLKEIEGTTDAPDEFIVPAFLAFWAGVVGNKIIGPSSLRPNINVILFADSSEIRKSTSIKSAGTPFNEVQTQLDEEHERELVAFEKRKAEWDRQSATAKTHSDPPIAPKRRYLILPGDFSEAGFIEMMKDNSLSGIIVASEYADFHQKLHRDYTGMADAFLAAYDNDTMRRVTRMHGFESVQNPTFSILGATTFENFRKVFSGMEKENGTLQRIIAVAVMDPTKERISFLDRKEIDPAYIERMSKQILNWLNYSDDLMITISKGVSKRFSEWEREFLQRTKAEHGEEIMSFTERLSVSCLKVAMLCETLELEGPNSMDSVVLSMKSLDCAISLTEKLFLPSIAYILKNEVIMDRIRYHEKQIENAIKELGGEIDRSTLMRTTRINSRDLDEALKNLKEKEYISIHKKQIARFQGGGNPKMVYKWIKDKIHPRNSGKSGNSGSISLN